MHEELNELLSLYALGALEGDDLRKVEEHLAAGCNACADELSSFDFVQSQLAWAAAPATPPAGLRGRVLEAVGERNVPLPFRPQPRPEPRRWKAGAVAAVAALAAAAAFAVVFLTWALLDASRKLDVSVRQLADAREKDRQQQQRIEKQDQLLGIVNDPEVRFTRLSASGAPEPGIDVLWQPTQKRGLLYARGLPKVEPNKSYELWLIAGAAPVPAVVFNTDAAGNAVVEIDQIPDAATPKVFAITVEPAGGSKAPTTKPVFVGNYAGA